jgi:hypothetical protein
LAIDLTKEYAVKEQGTGALVIDVPANTADGNLLIGVCYVQAATDNHSSANGFTQFVNNLNTVYGNSRMTVWWKRASGEGATITFNHSNNTTTAGLVIRIPGVIATGSPFDSATTLNTTMLGQTVNCAEITTGTDGAAVIMVAARVQAATYSLETLTRRIIQQGGGGDASLFADLKAVAGATGAQSVKNATANGYNHGALFSLKPLIEETTYMPDKWWRNTEQPPAFLHKNRIVGY